MAEKYYNPKLLGYDDLHNRYHVRVDAYEKLEEIAMLHTTIATMCGKLGISRTAFNNLMKRDPKFKNAIEKGRAEGKIQIQYRIFQEALDGNDKLLIHLAKHWLGHHDRTLQANVDAEFMDKDNAEYNSLAELINSTRKRPLKVVNGDDDD